MDLWPGAHTYIEVKRPTFVGIPNEKGKVKTKKGKYFEDLEGRRNRTSHIAHPPAQEAAGTYRTQPGEVIVLPRKGWSGLWRRVLLVKEVQPFKEDERSSFSSGYE